MRFYRLLLTSLAGAAVLATGLHASSAVIAGTSVSGGGQVNATDDFGGYFPNAGTIDLNARQNPDGSASGSINFVGRGDFAAAWGACPIDPRCEDFPNTNTTMFRLRGQVSSVVSLGTSVEISGLLTETDHGKGDGVIFEELDVPFVITVTEGSRSFVLQFCLVPPFTMDLAAGNLSVTAGAPTAALLRKPAAIASLALSCHSPESRPAR
jgi:hypothetical protein